MNYKAVSILKAVVLLCMALVIVLAFCAPWLITVFYTQFHYVTELAQRTVLITYYCCAVPALIALFFMYKLLQKIKGKQPFDLSNTTYLSVISWCCLAVSLITFVGGFGYGPLWLICGSMAFLFLVVRVVCSCFVAAASLQEENDLTV